MNNIIEHRNYELDQIKIEDMYTKTLTKETKRSYMQTIKEFFGVNELNEVSIQDMQSVTPDTVNEYAHRLLKKGLKPATVNKKLSALQSFYSFLCRRAVGVMTYNPCSTNEGAIRFKNAAKQYSDKRALTPSEVKGMIEATKYTEGLAGIRDRIIIELLATTGMRRAELCSIKLGDIKVDSGKKIIEIIGKGDKPRIIVLSSHISELIDKYVAGRELTYKDVDMPLITSHGNRGDSTKPITKNSVYRIIKQYAKYSGLDETTISPHCLRHTYATQCIEMGIELQDVKDLMAHSSINTTLRYNHSYNVIKNNPADKLYDLYND